MLRGKEDGAHVRVVRTLLDRTKRFRGNGEPVRAAVIEDREFEDGELVERTLDYFAQDDRGTVWYLGEDVDSYENGKVVGHGGAWLYGKDTNKMGVGMPAHPRVGTRWRHEDVPGDPFESDKAVAILDKATVRGKTYHDVLKVRERPGPTTRSSSSSTRRASGTSRNGRRTGASGSSAAIERRHDELENQEGTDRGRRGGRARRRRRGDRVGSGEGGDDDATQKSITGSALQKASDAALEHTGGGKVTETEVGDEESYYEVEVTTDEGQQDVQLDRNFNVVGGEDDSDSGEDED